MKHYGIISAFISFVFFALCTASYASETGPEGELAMLRQKVAELENRINELETALAKYCNQEKILDESGYGWQNKKNWRKLEKGMSTEDVLTLLGHPIKTIDGVKTLWYYPDIYRGYVSFDNKGRLTGWREP